jgi:hypothetical protein
MTRYWTPFVCALMAACSGAADGDAPLDGNAPSTEEAQYTDTIVTIDAEGRMFQSVIAVTAQARQAELQAFEKAEVPAGASARATVNGDAEAVSGRSDALLRPNTACASSDLWVYDESFANRLCISGSHLGFNQSDSLDFSTIRYGSFCLQVTIDGSCLNRWAGKVAWVWPGSNAGRIYPNNGSGTPPSALFGAWGALQHVDPATAQILWLWGPYLG